MAEVTIGDVKRFLEEGPDGRKVTMAEFKALTDEDKQELKDSLAVCKE